MATFVLASAAGDEVADFIRALVRVYGLLIIAYILTQLFFGFGGRLPYNRWVSAVIGFLNETVQPYLNIFRRFIPQLGPIDISPIVALIVLQVVGGLIANAVDAL